LSYKTHLNTEQIKVKKGERADLGDERWEKEVEAI
jgi:hypothetical protein